MPTKGLHLSEDKSKALDEIAYANRMSVSPLLRDSLLFYLSENPDGLSIPEDELATLQGGESE